MSKSEINAKWRSKLVNNRKFSKNSWSNAARCYGIAFPLLILSDLTPSCAATRRNLAADDCTGVALERIKPEGSPTRRFPLHQVRTGPGWTSLTVHQAPALPTAPSARTGIPLKHALGLHSLSEDDTPFLVRGRRRATTAGNLSAGEGVFKSGDTMAAMCIEGMESKGAAAGPPVICWAHIQGLGRGQAAIYGADCTNQAAEVKAGFPPVLILPIPDLDQQRPTLSKVSLICFSLYLIQLTLWPTAVSWTPPAAGIIHPRHCAIRCISPFQC
jgi:hypothetical protein